jgi:phosphoglycolate phosphatase-like HAD superfamily hydrolase
MHPLFNYDLYIFDCDGVILDANQIKVTAMAKAVSKAGFSEAKTEACRQNFANNFGKSRFVHIRHFVENILNVDANHQESVYQEILKNFSDVCREEYSSAYKTPRFDEALKALPGRKAVASGSEQEELRNLFEKRNMADSFESILGSPTAKSENVAEILRSIPHEKAVMIGDAVADFEAAQANGIDFIAYLPFSNVPGYMKKLSESKGFLALDEWPILNGES